MIRDFFGKIIREDPFTGRKYSKKQIKRGILAESRERGRIGEDNVRTSLILQGYDVERTGRGSDFKIRKTSILTSRKGKARLIEVKTGKARQSKLQKETQRKSKRYSVIRADSIF